MNHLTPTELRDFTALVKEAHTHRNSAFRFVEILTEIKTRQLQRATGETFDEFVKREFDIDAKRAYAIISAGEVAKRVSEISDIKPNEAQAKQLGRLPEEQQAEAWQEVVESTDEPTAKAVREVVERKLPDKAVRIPVPEYDDEPAEAETIHSYYSEFLELWHRADEPARAMIRIFVEEQ